MPDLLALALVATRDKPPQAAADKGYSGRRVRDLLPDALVRLSKWVDCRLPVRLKNLLFMQMAVLFEKMVGSPA